MAPARICAATDSVSNLEQMNLQRCVGIAALGVTLALWSHVSGATYDGLTCSGHFVSLGETPEAVLSECGQPQRVYKSNPSVKRPDTWEYERDGSFPRVLHFRNGRLVSVVAASRFRE
jgi:Protein of unknown function (DUF2845)